MIHDRLRVPQDPNSSPKRSMHFGGIEKFSGNREHLGETTKSNYAMDERKSMRASIMDKSDQSEGGRVQQRIQDAMRSQTAAKNTDKFPEGDLRSKRTETLLGDTYLPVLRSFQTTQRAPVKPREAQIAEYRKQQLIDSQKPLVPKQINVDNINHQKTVSLFDRQRNILVHAQMQQPVKKNKTKEMQKTRFKDWVVNEAANKVKAQEDEAKLRATTTPSKDKANEDKSDSSDHEYDPLADSDSSSAVSDSPPKITSDELRQTIQRKFDLI